MRYKVQRLDGAAHFARLCANSGRSFDAVIIDTEAKRPVDREIAVAPYVMAQAIATTLNTGVFDATTHR